MTTLSYSLSPLAESDIDAIWLYFARFDIENADRYLEVLTDTFQLLGDHPLIGRERSEISDGLRYLPKDNYCIFYHPNAAGVRIMRILHAARDLDAIVAEGGLN